MAKIDGHANVVRGVAFSPDSRRLISGGWDHLVCVWDLETRTKLSALPVEMGVGLASSAIGGRGRRRNRLRPDPLQLGLSEIPVHVARDLSPEQFKAHCVPHDETAELTERKTDLLPLEWA